MCPAEGVPLTEGRVTGTVPFNQLVVQIFLKKILHGTKKGLIIKEKKKEVTDLWLKWLMSFGHVISVFSGDSLELPVSFLITRIAWLGVYWVQYIHLIEVITEKEMSESIWAEGCTDATVPCHLLDSFSGQCLYSMCSWQKASYNVRLNNRPAFQLLQRMTLKGLEYKQEH